MKLSLTHIIKWEYLSKKPFSMLNYSDNTDVLHLMYCLCAKTDETVDQYTNRATKKEIEAFVKDLLKALAYIEQFQIPKQKKEAEADEATDQEAEATEPQYIRDIIAQLATHGISPKYLLEEVELYELPTYIKAVERKQRESLIQQRLFTFMQCRKDYKKGLKPEQLLPFPWEKEEHREKGKKLIEKYKDHLKAFTSMGNYVFPKGNK